MFYFLCGWGNTHRKEDIMDERQTFIIIDTEDSHTTSVKADDKDEAIQTYLEYNAQMHQDEFGVNQEEAMESVLTIWQDGQKEDRYIVTGVHSELD